MILPKDELNKKTQEAFSVSTSDVLLSTGDGNFFMPKAASYANEHAKKHGLEVTKVTRPVENEAPKEAAVDVAENSETAATNAATTPKKSTPKKK